MEHIFWVAKNQLFLALSCIFEMFLGKQSRCWVKPPPPPPPTHTHTNTHWVQKVSEDGQGNNNKTMSPLSLQQQPKQRALSSYKT